MYQKKRREEAERIRREEEERLMKKMKAAEAKKLAEQRQKVGTYMFADSYAKLCGSCTDQLCASLLCPSITQPGIMKLIHWIVNVISAMQPLQPLYHVSAAATQSLETFLCVVVTHCYITSFFRNISSN